MITMKKNLKNTISFFSWFLNVWRRGEGDTAISLASRSQIWEDAGSWVKCTGMED